MYKLQTLPQRTIQTPYERSSKWFSLHFTGFLISFPLLVDRQAGLPGTHQFDYSLGKDRTMHRTNASAARRNQKRTPKRRKRGPVTNEQPGTSAGGCCSRWKLRSKVGCIALSLTAVHACKNKQGIFDVCFLQLRLQASDLRSKQHFLQAVFPSTQVTHQKPFASFLARPLFKFVRHQLHPTLLQRSLSVLIN